MCIWRKSTSCTHWKCNILSILSRKRYELCFWWCKWNFVIHFGGELDLKKIAKINNLISFTMTISNLIAKILKINNFIAEILKINNLTPDELPESKEFNRNFENSGFFFCLWLFRWDVHQCSWKWMFWFGLCWKKNDRILSVTKIINLNLVSVREKNHSEKIFYPPPSPPQPPKIKWLSSYYTSDHVSLCFI